jgi:hypothetical protein
MNVVGIGELDYGQSHAGDYSARNSSSRHIKSNLKVLSRPPRPPAPLFDNIPPELKVLSRWLCWRYSDRPNGSGTFGKVPHNILGRKANFTNPREWLPFEGALRQYFVGGYDGVGVILGGGLCGLDEDRCCKKAGINEDAARHIELLNSYSEFSVSGQGVHILAVGTLPDQGRKRGNHELYSESRYLVVTGRKLVGVPMTVAFRERELHELHAMIFRKKGESIQSDSPVPRFGTDDLSIVTQSAPISREERSEELIQSLRMRE